MVLIWMSTVQWNGQVDLWIYWFIDCLIDRLVEWLIDWLISRCYLWYFCRRPDAHGRTDPMRLSILSSNEAVSKLELTKNNPTWKHLTVWLIVSHFVPTYYTSPISDISILCIDVIVRIPYLFSILHRLLKTSARNMKVNWSVICDTETMNINIFSIWTWAIKMPATLSVITKRGRMTCPNYTVGDF